MNVALLGITALWLPADAGAAAVAFEFRDTTTHEGRSMLHYRAIEFRDSPVQPLAGDLEPTPGALYGQVPVGPAPETALAVAWLPKAADGPVLWFDANADGRLTVGERHVVSEQEIGVPATVTVRTEPEVERVPRTLLFRRPIVGTGLRYAVRGYAAGSLNFGGARHSVLLVDGNADGCLDTVGEDRVWIDLNQDGRFDALVEQFPLGKPVLKEGQVYVVRSDPLAAAVSANLRRPGEDKLRLTLADISTENVATFSAELVSDLGELVAVDKLDEPVPVPHGQYRVSWLKLQMADADGQPWNYSFSRRRQRYVSVPIGRQTTLPLLGEVAMQVTLDMDHKKARPSETITVRPQVIAGDETLYLSSCYVGEEERSRSSEGSAETLLLSPDGKIVSRGVSGFS